MTAYAVAFVGGLIGSVHCLGMCGGFPIGLARTRAGASPQLVYNLGRLNALLLIGAASGALGGVLLASGPAASLQRLLGVVAGLAMLAIGLERLGLIGAVGARLGAPVGRAVGGALHSVLAVPSAATPFLVGGLNELLPCHLVYAFAAQAAATGSVLGGVATMAAFGLGTVPAMVGLGLGSAALRRRPALRQAAERTLALALSVYGLVLVAQAFSASPAHHH